jgi:hypothetical protein
MTFLKTLGSILLKGLQIVLGFAPVAEASFPAQAGVIGLTVDRLQQIADIIVQVEAMGQAITAPGPRKLVMAAIPVEQIILASSLLVNHTIADPVKFKAAVSGIASNMADLLNSLQADGMLTQSKVAPPASPAAQP